MTYWDQADLSEDADLRRRVVACAALEGITEPEAWAHRYRWELSAEPGWAQAYTYAVGAGKERPGRDASVITDGMILSAVQVLIGGGA